MANADAVAAVPEAVNDAIAPAVDGPAGEEAVAEPPMPMVAIQAMPHAERPVVRLNNPGWVPAHVMTYGTIRFFLIKPN